MLLSATNATYAMKPSDTAACADSSPTAQLCLVNANQTCRKHHRRTGKRCAMRPAVAPVCATSSTDLP